MSKKTLFLLYLLSILSCIVFGARVFVTQNLRFWFLVWNLFLAWIPLVITLIIIKITPSFKKDNSLMLKGGYILLCLLWLIFYPNAPYIFTDIIHISPYDYVLFEPDGMRYFTYGFNDRFIIWYDLMMIFTFIITGLLIGFYSLLLLQQKWFGNAKSLISWSFVVGVIFLSSVGIYIGRFIRFNSWDIFVRPLHIFEEMINQLDFNSLALILLFGTFYLVWYLSLYMFHFSAGGESKK